MNFIYGYNNQLKGYSKHQKSVTFTTLNMGIKCNTVGEGCTS